MGIWFEPYVADSCCLCGATENLTGEHKIKASALRSVFKDANMVIGHFDGTSEPRSAQGPKSKAFHFNSRMCAPCNSMHTQEADREFDRFHAAVTSLTSEGRDPAEVFDMPPYAIGTKEYHFVFRYFAKILSCHVAESGGPRARQVTEYARHVQDQNPIFLYIDRDPTYAEFAAKTGEHAYAAHGGLQIVSNKNTNLPTSFRSSLSIGAVRYQFWVRFETIVGLALMFAHRDFFEKCQAAMRAAIADADET